MDDQVNLLNYLGVVRKRKRLIISVFLLAVCASLAGSLFIMPRSYKASTSLIVSQPSSAVGGLAGAMTQLQQTPLAGLVPSAAVPGDLYVAILKSRTIAKQLVNDLGLFPERKSEEEAIRNLQKATTVDLGKGGLIEITVELEGTPQANSIFAARGGDAPAPDTDTRNLVAEVANYYVEALTAYANESVLFRARSNRIFIGQQLEKTTDELQRAEEALRNFKQKNRTVSLSDEAKGLIANMATFESERLRTQTDLKATESRLKTTGEQIVEETRTPLVSVPLHSPFIQDLRKQLVDQEARLALALKEYGESHPNVVKLQLQIAETRNQLNDEIARILRSVKSRLAPELINLEADRIALEARLEAQGNVVGSYGAKLQGVPPLETELTRLTRDATVLETTYTMLAEEYEKGRIAEAKEAVGFQTLDRAVPPERKSKPRVKLNLAVAGMLGLFLGILWSFLGEYLEQGKTSRKEDHGAPSP